MMMDVPLNSDTFVMYAMKHYDNPQCLGMDEFNDDLNRTKYLKRLFKKYELSGALKERLILNHIIIFYNVFGIIPATRLLFYKIDEEFYPTLKTFLVFLSCLPEKDIPETDLIRVPLDHNAMRVLREI